MVRKSPWIDKPRMSSSLGDARLVSSRLSREGSTVMGRVLAFESGGARVEFPADAPVSEGWGPTDGGVSAVGALVRVLIGADGRIMMIASPDSLPEGAAAVATGVTGEAALDAASSASEAHAAAAATQQALDQAQAQLDAAMARIDDPDTGLDASQSKADDAVFAAVQATQKATTATETAQKALDTAVLRIDSSRGLVFKNSLVSTVLTVTVIRGGEPITNIVDLQAAYGAGVYLEWSWKRLGESDFGVLSSADSRISDGGFTLTVSPEDVDTKTVFMCSLNA